MLRAAEGVGHPSAGRHVRRRDGGPLMMLPFLAFRRSSPATIFGGYLGVTHLPGMLAGAAARAAAARRVGGVDDPAAEGDRNSWSSSARADRCRSSIKIARRGRSAGSWLGAPDRAVGRQDDAERGRRRSAVMSAAVGRADRIPVHRPACGRCARCRERRGDGADSAGWCTSDRCACRSSRSSFPKRSTCCRARIRAGHAFQTAMGMVADELPEPVGPEFKKTFDQQNFGLPLRDALERDGRARRRSSTCASS